MMNNAKIGLALVGGYFLGRTKKAKMAIGLGMFLGGRKLNLNPQELLKTVQDSPVLGGLTDQVRKELIGATKSAATSALTNRANSLASSLEQRTVGLTDPVTGGTSQDDEEATDREDDADEVQDGRSENDGADGADAAEDDERREPEEAPRSARRTAASGGKSAAARAASGGRRPSGGGGGKAASGASKTAATTASKTASKTAPKKTASKPASARKTSTRGGSHG